MKLSQICKEIELTCLQGNMEAEVADIIYDSRKIEEGTMFVCMVGAVTDGHKYIPDAVAKKASVIVVEREEEAAQVPEEITVLKADSTRYALALMSAAFFGYPARELVTIGLTGTKGKTTTTYMVKSVLEEAGKKVGLIGTIGALVGDVPLPAKNTTPESYELHKMFRAMVDAGCEYVVMEVSSQGLKMDRVAGISFDYGIFTNLSPDHIGPTEHETFEEYMQCKSLLFRQCKVGIANIDDEHWKDVLCGHTCELKTFSCGQDADLIAGALGFLDDDGRLGMHFTTTGCMDVYARVYIPGRFSVYNSLVTMLTCHLAGISDEEILRVTYGGHIEVAESKKELISHMAMLGKGVVVLDYTTLDFRGIEDLLILHKRFPEFSWVLCSAELSDDFIRRAAVEDNIGIIFKDCGENDIEVALRSAAAGGRHLCRQAEAVVNSPRGHKEIEDMLTPSEIDILKLIARGRSVKEIAAERHSSAHTIITHKKNIFRKLEVNNVYEATKYALRAGLLEMMEYYI